MSRKPLAIATMILCLMGCQDKQLEAMVAGRCESLLAAQELASLPDALRNDPRAPIRPKGDARVSDGERITFVRRAYDRLAPDGPSTRIEPREYSCKFDKKAGKVITLSTNGHTQEIRDSDSEWAIKQRASLSTEKHQR